MAAAIDRSAPGTKETGHGSERRPLTGMKLHPFHEARPQVFIRLETRSPIFPLFFIFFPSRPRVCLASS